MRAMTVTARTSFGALCGTEADGVLCFLGVPYAKPPVGALRFREPEAPEPWSGTRSAQRFGNAALQLPNKLAQVGEPSEDCLYLNVWTQGLTGQRPVMVFVHGGGYVFGSASEPTYVGRALAERGDAVVVTINYRLSALGFLYLSEVLPNAGCPANAGLLDVLAALSWVRDEIAAFGGDPTNVTVFGESAGGGIVSALYAVERARGWFSRAISQSGGLRVMPTHAASAIASELLHLLDIDPKRPERLWALPGEQIVAATSRLTSPGLWGVSSREANAVRPTFRFGPVADGALLPDDLVRGVIHQANPAPLLIGTNLHEWRFFSRLVPEFAWGEPGSIQSQLRVAFGAHAELLLETYARAADLLGASLEDTADAIIGDAVFRMPSICLAQATSAHAPVFMYLLDHRCRRRRGALGACHVVDLGLVFRTLESPSGRYFAGDTPEARSLSDVMSDAWLAFARNGNPCTKALAPWPAYDATRRATRMLGPLGAVVDDPLAAQRCVWEQLGRFSSAPPLP